MAEYWQVNKYIWKSTLSIFRLQQHSEQVTKTPATKLWQQKHKKLNKNSSKENFEAQILAIKTIATNIPQQKFWQ